MTTWQIVLLAGGCGLLGLGIGLWLVYQVLRELETWINPWNRR